MMSPSLRWLVAMPDTDECIEWPFARRNGYGVVKIDGRVLYVHRLVLAEISGVLGDEAMHACHNRPCVNPRHLSWGSRAANARDSAEVWGTLTAEQVVDIRRRYAEGETQCALATEFPVGRTTIGAIVRDETWAHLTLTPTGKA